MSVLQGISARMSIKKNKKKNWDFDHLMYVCWIAVAGCVFSFTHDSLRKTANHEQTKSIVEDPASHWRSEGSSACVNVVMYEPFVVREFVSMVVRWHDVHQEYVLGFGVESCDLHLVAGEHPPAGRRKRRRRRKIL